MAYRPRFKTAETYKQEIEDLKAKNSFLRLEHNDVFGRFHGPGFSDIVLLNAKGGPNDDQSKPVPAHGAILASRSPVFKAMLEHEMEESRSNTIKISEVSYDVLRAFVSYLYSAEACLDDEQMAYDLLALAEMYQVQHLKAYCEKFLVSELNWENSVINYAFARQHDAKLLLKTALAIIIVNKYKLKSHPEYSELVKSDPRLLLEIYEACLAEQAEEEACLAEQGEEDA